MSIDQKNKQNDIETTEENSKKSEAPKTSFFNDFLDLLETALISVFVVAFIFTFLFRVAVVKGTSMEETLFDGDKLIVNKLFYTPKTLDIIVIDNVYAYLFADDTEQEIISKPGIDNDLNEKYIVKRVIATGGQTVDIDFAESVVYVDGKALEDEYVTCEWHNNLNAFNYPIVIPEGYVYVLGDNRAVSNDSRSPEVGLVKVEDIIGHCVFRIYPFNKIGLL
jgi:signal peptidase I